ncbi:MAG: biopolymer transporter ExbD [Candidatus Aureabacteria bacterium]|nr:biopolymer transporter ExbD [Candidatus Auribacterota bacterium]
MRRRHSARTRLTPLADINLTSMIDVIFFMLILFLLVAPIVEYGINVNLPAASAKKMEEPQTLTVNVKNTATGPRIYLDRDRLTLDELTSRLKSIAARQPDIALILRADKELNYESVIQVIDCITEAGITKLGMATVAKAETPKKQRKK